MYARSPCAAHHDRALFALIACTEIFVEHVMVSISLSGTLCGVSQLLIMMILVRPLLEWTHGAVTVRPILNMLRACIQHSIA